MFIGWVGLVILVVTCNQLSATTPYPGVAALLPVLGTVLLIGAGCTAPSQGAGRVLAWAPMRAVGRVSYSWYLWHWPVLVLTPALLGHPLGMVGRLIAVLASGGLAVLTLTFIENPLRFAARLRRSPLGSLALGGVATAIAVCVGVVLLDSVPTSVGRGRGAAAAPVTITAVPPPTGSDMDAYDTEVRHAFAQIQAAVAASAELKAVPSNLNPPLDDAAAESRALSFNGCLRMSDEGGQPECATGDTVSPTTVALVGDSTAAMWNPAFQEIAAQRHWRLELLSRAACPLMSAPITTPYSRLISRLINRAQYCEEWRGQILARLRTEHPKLVVVSMWRGYATSYDPAWIDSLSRLVQQLRGFGARVLVLGPIPALHMVVPICLSGHLDDVAACSPTRATAVNKPGIAAGDRRHRRIGSWIRRPKLFCTKIARASSQLPYLQETICLTHFRRGALGGFGDSQST